MYAISARVSYNIRPRIFCLSCVHNITQFYLIHWRCNRNIRNASEISNVVGSVMCCPILTNQSCPVETENHMQILKCHIVQCLIKSPLHKRRINITERNHSFCSQSGRKRYSMLLCNTYVESPFRHFLK